MDPQDPSAVQVRNAARAVREALVYFQGKSLPQAPPPGTAWTERTLYAEGIEDYAVTSKLFTSGDWKAEVSQDVVPLSHTVYCVTIFNARSGWYWQGQVKADGNVVELKEFQLLPEQEKQALEAALIHKSQVPPPRPGGYGH